MEQHSGQTLGDLSRRALAVRMALRRTNSLPDDNAWLTLERFVELLLEWNKKVNLISRKDEDAVWEAHILHSLSLAITGDLPSGCAVLDLGSGGGLPGIPIAIVRNDTTVTMLDATRKKMDAVGSIVETLGLKNATTVWGRAEELKGRKELFASFDIVVARGVAQLDELIRWGQPYLRRRADATVGRILALKGGGLDNEVQRASERWRRVSITTHALTFPGSELLPGVDKKLVSVTFQP